MSVPADKLMEMIRGDQAKEETPEDDATKPALSGAEAPPMGAPMLTPEDKRGDLASAKVNVQMAMDLMQQSLPIFGSDSEEGKKILQTLGSLARVFGETEAKTKELIPAEIIQMIQSLPQAGGASPEMKAIAKAPIGGTQSPPIPI